MKRIIEFEDDDSFLFALATISEGLVELSQQSSDTSIETSAMSAIRSTTKALNKLFDNNLKNNKSKALWEVTFISLASKVKNLAEAYINEQ